MNHARHYFSHLTSLSHGTVTGIALFALTVVGLLLSLGGGNSANRQPATAFRDSTNPIAALDSPTPVAGALYDRQNAPQSLIPAGSPQGGGAIAVAPGAQAPAVAAAPVIPAPGSSTVLLGTITDDYVNMRSGPDYGYRILSQLPDGARLQVVGQQSGWYKVATAWGASGWVSGDYIKVDAQPSAPPQPPRIGSASTVGIVNLRSGPGTGYPVLRRLADSALLDVLALQGEWYSVRTQSGIVGWVAADYVALDWIPDIYGGSGPPPGASSSDAARIAQKYLGARYVWGGSYPDGFDCSGLTWYVYGKLGVWLPAGTWGQFDTSYGRYIGSMDKLAPGDLVFFENTTEDGGVSHVGIYAGAKKMIAARSERLGVRYVSLAEPFWATRFVGGIRPYR